MRILKMRGSKDMTEQHRLTLGNGGVAIRPLTQLRNALIAATIGR
jgi:hypothetical protein